MGPFLLGSAAALSDLVDVACRRRPVRLTAAARAGMSLARRAVERAVASDRKIYGVNTGFGQLAFQRISRDDIQALNLNYIRSHSSGVGEPLSEPESRGVVFLRANELARGYAACRPEVVDGLAALLNKGVTPRIPSQGSVGASGDLAPMAHVALLLIGEGEAFCRGRRLRGAKALEAAGIQALRPQAKEALSLTNGTQAMQAVGGLCLHRALLLLDAADLAGAASLEAIKGSPGPYDARISRLKPHPGQVRTAERLRRFLAGSEIRQSHRSNDERVQDPYSYRCIPQIHGTVRDALDSVRTVLELEMRSVTDNPILAGGDFLSGGNFHGMALAVALDHAAIVTTILGGVSERRIYHMTLGVEPGLPLYLAENPGLQSGFMIPQYVAAALASENKTLAHPASADSVPTSANKEDYVSMGMWAALKLRRVVSNAANILAIELLTADQGLEFQRPLAPGKGVARAMAFLRSRVPHRGGDRTFSDRIRSVRDLILEGAFGKS